MDKIIKESKKVFDVVETYGPIQPSEIGRLLKLSAKTVHKHLNRLIDEDKIYKIGSTPKTYYSVKEEADFELAFLTNQDDFIVEQNYIYVSSGGQIIRGVKGFAVWCRKNGFDFEKEKKKYVSQIKALQKLKKNNLFPAKKKILSGSMKIILDEIFFSDFYTFGHFGKTKLGQLVYLGKMAQDKALINEIAEIIRPSIFCLIKKYNIENVAFIPPTINRELQFMDILEKKLKINLDKIKVEKIPGLKIAQKTIRKLEDRINNARLNIVVSPDQKIKGNILLIDDATGSGATLNETAKKIKKISNKKIKIIGYSVVGSYKGFDVISEI